MKFFKTTNGLLLTLSILYAILIAVAFFILRNSALISQETLKLSDFIGAALAAASIFIGIIAAIFSSKSLKFAQKAEEGQLYIQMMERYASEEMVQALRVIGEFAYKHAGNMEEGIKKWHGQLKQNDAVAIEIEKARHRIKYFYRDLMQLYQAGYFTENLTKRILNPGGRELFKKVVLPMEQYTNPYQFEKEYYPFEEFYNDLNQVQKRI